MKIPHELRDKATAEQVVQVATTDAKGIPHLALARGFRMLDEEHIAFENWFCFQTLENLSMNPHVAVSVVSATGENGYQLIGTVEGAGTTEVLDGYTPNESESLGAIPQTKTQLQIKVEKVLALSTGPHSDDV